MDDKNQTMKRKETIHVRINIATVVLVVFFGLFYSFYGLSLGLIARMFALVPILFIAIHYGMQMGAISGFCISIFMSIVSIVAHDTVMSQHR